MPGANLENALAEHLRRRGVDPREFWLPLHTHPPFAAAEESFPNATLVSARGLWLPSALSLTREHVASVGASVREFAQTPRAAALS